MFISKVHLDRRTFLRGMGATIALPLLDAMIPARTALAATAARPVPRLAFVYFPHGAIMHEWTPGSAGPLGQLGRILEPLSAFKDRLTIVSGLENRHAYGPVHAITPGTWLSGASPRTAGGSFATADQIAADEIGRDTPLRSIELGTEAATRIPSGAWEGDYHESFGATTSFRGSSIPLPMEFNPRRVFNTLFTRGTVAQGFSQSVAQGFSPAMSKAVAQGFSPAISKAVAQGFSPAISKAVAQGFSPAISKAVAQGFSPARTSTSVLDLVAADTARLQTRLGPSDCAVLHDYLDAVRDVERRADSGDATPFPERLQLMFDMMALAFQADITRVASIMMAAETSQRTYEQIDVPDAFHLLSHHQYDPEKMEKLVRIQRYHTSVFAAFVQKLADLPDGDGSLLDRSLILYGSNMSDSHAHDHFPLPAALVGGGCGRLRGGHHVRYPDRTPLSNLLITMLSRVDVPVESIGDSTGECPEV